MIIDSHTHYSHPMYTGEFPYVDDRDGQIALARGDREEMLDMLSRRGISLCIEPSIGLEGIEAQLALAAHHPGFRIALGVHPKRCGHLSADDRAILRAYVLAHPETVAIGETGLDYHLPTEQLDKPCQQMWFSYQIDLAHERELPLILHVRMADGDALEILRKRRDRLHGGVAHCFGGDYRTAMEYIDLGFALGIGGRILHDDEIGRTLRDTVRNVPLTTLLAETDAPFILPELDGVSASGNQKKKARNTSLILPTVIGEIARVRGEPYETVEQAIYENTVRVFRLSIPV